MVTLRQPAPFAAITLRANTDIASHQRSEAVA
jgi:hypothetical protein